MLIKNKLREASRVIYEQRQFYSGSYASQFRVTAGRKAIATVQIRREVSFTHISLLRCNQYYVYISHIVKVVLKIVGNVSRCALLREKHGLSRNRTVFRNGARRCVIYGCEFLFWERNDPSSPSCPHETPHTHTHTTHHTHTPHTLTHHTHLSPTIDPLLLFAPLHLSS